MRLALSGVISQPATPSHISGGILIDDHALIRTATGGRELYAERTTEPVVHILRKDINLYLFHEVEILIEALERNTSAKLAQISDTLPTFVAGAYSLYSQRQLSESLIDGWIVIEQIIDWIWEKYKAQFKEKSRKDRLSDTRTYTVGVRTELLYTAGVIQEELYSSINSARKHRNDLAHRAKIDLEMTTSVMNAMKQVIEFHCETTIANYSSNVGINW